MAEEPGIERNTAFIERLSHDLIVIRKAAKRCEAVVSALLTYSRKTKYTMDTIDINAVIRDALLLLSHQLTLKGIELIEKLESGLPEITGNANQLQQVFTNIIMNACHAMPDGGRLTVQSRLTDNNMIEVSIADTGTGISPELIDKIFEPFFTLSADPKGTGLGLSVTYGIIKEHKGDINIYSEVGKGTTFKIILPVRGQLKGE
jgi:signal transduction histidine kinase